MRDEGDVAERARLMTEELRADGLRVEYDDRVDTSFGRRVVDWELKGIPVRLEVGPRDLADNQVTLARRDTGDKNQVSVWDMRQRVEDALDEAQHALLDRALAARDARIHDVEDFDAAVEAAEDGWARVPWDVVGDAGEAALNERGLTVRCLQQPDGSLPGPEGDDELVAFVARSY